MQNVSQTQLSILLQISPFKSPKGAQFCLNVENSIFENPTLYKHVWKHCEILATRLGLFNMGDKMSTASCFHLIYAFSLSKTHLDIVFASMSCLKVNKYQNYCHNKPNSGMIFLICYLASLWPTLSHYQGDTLTRLCQVLTQRLPGGS